MKLTISQSKIIDCLKLLMAFLVVGIHVGKVAEYQYPDCLEFLTRIAVPFFFGVSGFLSYNSAVCGKLINSLYKYFYYFLIWVIVYVLFAAACYLKNDSFDVVIQYFSFRCFFITGEPPMAWHLWYLHAMILLILVISLCFRIKVKSINRFLFFLWIISIIILVLREITDYSGIWESDILHYLSMNHYQNALFTGLPVFLTGMVVAAVSDKIRQNLNTFIASVLLFSVSFILFLFGLHLYVVVSSLSMLLFVLSVNINIGIETNIIRELSKYVFFLHLIFVFLLRSRFNNVYFLWVFVIAATLIVSLLLILTNNKKLQLYGRKNK